MKKILSLTILLTSTIWCCAQDYTYSTNLFYALAYPTNIYIGTNGTDPGGDSFHVWACKINHNTTLANNVNIANAWTIAHAATNQGSGYTFTNGNFAGNGTWLIIQGTNLVLGTVNSNAFDGNTLAWLQSCLVPGVAMNFDAGNITSDGSGDMTVNGTASFLSSQAVIDYGGNGVQLKINGGSGYQSGGAQIDVAGAICMTAAGEVDIGNNGSFTDPSPGAGYDVKCGGAAGGITSIGQINANAGYLFGNSSFLDSSGNCYAQTFNPISDRARKERIVPLAPTNALTMAMALDDYAWRFKAHTNTVGHVQPASGTEFGPMAQDWHAVTGLGGGTNISMTSMSGLLLGAIQGLAQAQGIFTNAHGARFGLMVNATTNGFIFVPLP